MNPRSSNYGSRARDCLTAKLFVVPASAGIVRSFPAKAGTTNTHDLLIERLNGQSLIFSLGNFDQVEAELSLNRSVNGVEFLSEDDFVEFRNHLSLRELAKAAA